MGMMTTFREPTILGRTGLRVTRLGIGSSYGVPAAAIERAYHEYGVNYLCWGTIRRRGMRNAIRHLARTDRDKLVIALQSYDRTGVLMSVFLNRGLRSLGIDCADVLILSLHSREPSARVLDAARALQAQGKVRFLAMSGHHRPLFGELAQKNHSPADIFMIRYNAAHRGAEREIFPFLPARIPAAIQAAPAPMAPGSSGGTELQRGLGAATNGGALVRPGITAYTATRWGHLLQAKRMPPGERPLTAAECYRFVLSNPDVDVCLAGPADDHQMAEALTALDAGPLTSEEMDRARRIGDYVHG
jgi:aryl-alcohol dehydrogenase-like predicted oxidoreductase